MSFSFCDFLSGWGAGVCGLLVGHPADTIKVRQQVSKNAGILKIITSSIKHEGALSLYKGMSFPLLCAGTQNAIFFGVYGNTLRVLQSNSKEDSVLRASHGEKTPSQSYNFNVFIAGCIAGFVQCFSGCPVDLIKIKLQTKPGVPHVHEVMNAVRRIRGDSGWKGFYQGFHCMLWRDVLSYGLYTLIYTHFVQSGTPHREVSTILLAGGLAGTISWISIIPLDVVKSRLQSDNPRRPLYSGMKDCIIKSYKDCGIAVFGRGFWMISLRAFPVNAATFMGYEWCMNMCHRATQK
ncbi:solute carrier family 25 member 45 isoform X1 [Anabrus simplex]|uniref:solute carrier family 25 member 45 isoform X1 n=1 Tax=Anabrus simplex TaxID=316456 RepID=UPI0035A3B9BE